MTIGLAAAPLEELMVPVRAALPRDSLDSLVFMDGAGRVGAAGAAGKHRRWRRRVGAPARRVDRRPRAKAVLLVRQPHRIPRALPAAAALQPDIGLGQDTCVPRMGSASAGRQLAHRVRRRGHPAGCAGAHAASLCCRRPDARRLARPVARGTRSPRPAGRDDRDRHLRSRREPRRGRSHVPRVLARRQAHPGAVPGVRPAVAVPGPCFSLVDLPAWIAASCGIGDHPWRQAAGRDAAVAEFRACGDPDDPWVVDAARTWGIGEIAIRRLTENLRCATNGRRKLLRRGGDEELYDLENDPLELSPVTIGPAVEQSYGDEVATLRAALREASENVAVPPLKAGGKVQEIADIEARMKALGYL